jgi:hypothetical protein
VGVLILGIIILINWRLDGDLQKPHKTFTVYEMQQPARKKDELYIRRKGKEKVVFEVLRTVIMKISIFWDILLCSLLKVSQCFGVAFTSIFRVKEQATIMRQVASRACLSTDCTVLYPRG